MLNMLMHDGSFGTTPKLPNIQNSCPAACGAEKAAAPIERIWNWTAAPDAAFTPRFGEEN